MNIPKNIQNKIRRYLEFYWAQEHNCNLEQENLITKSLTSSLKRECFQATRVKVLKSIPFFKKFFSEKTLCSIADSMRKVHFSPGQYIYKVRLKIYFKQCILEI